MPKGRSLSLRLQQDAVPSAPPAPQRPPSRDHRSPFSALYKSRSHSTHSLAAPSVRASTLSLHIPSYFRRNALQSDDLAASYVQKTPLLTLKLSSLSFLDSLVQDDISSEPLYTIQTLGTTSTIKRFKQRSKTVERSAVIKWPTVVPAAGGNSVGVLVQMKDEHWRNADDFLRQSSSKNISSRKFNIPRYSHPLRWKRVGNSYWCTCPSVKGPIAILDPKVDSLPPRLKIYETLHDKHDSHPELVHSGVYTLLLDYLLVSALLLVTDIQEWMVVKKFEENEEFLGVVDESAGPSRPPSTGNSSIAAPKPISPSRWRKILDREPLFPKLNLRERAPSPSPSDVTPPTPTSMNQMAKIVNRQPLFPTLRSSSPTASISSVDSTDDAERSIDSRAPSPSSTSMFSTTTNPSAPAHNYLDPSFYAPPVPPLPARYAGSNRASTSFTSTTDASSPLLSVRGLPTPPQSAGTSPVSQTWRRSRTSISPDVPRPRTADSPRSSSPFGDISGGVTHTSGAAARRQIGFRRTDSISSTNSLPRPLPAPPTAAKQIPPLKSALRVSSRRTSSTPRSLPPTPSHLTGTHLLRQAGPSSVTLAEDYTREGRSTRYRDSDRGCYPVVVHDDEDGEGEEKMMPPVLEEWKRALGPSRPSADRGRLGRGDTASVFDMPPPAYNSLFDAPPSRVEISLEEPENARSGTA